MKLYIAVISSDTEIEKTTSLPISSQTEPVYKLTLQIVICENRRLYGSYRFRKEVSSKRNIKLSTLCEYLNSKIAHCKLSEYVQRGIFRAELSCNFEWLVSIIETEFDYHLGKKICTKKVNEKYMNEYTATQLSGFGERFYDISNNISLSSIAKLYPMNIKDKESVVSKGMSKKGSKGMSKGMSKVSTNNKQHNKNK